MQVVKTKFSLLGPLLNRKSNKEKGKEEPKRFFTVEKKEYKKKKEFLACKCKVFR